MNILSCHRIYESYRSIHNFNLNFFFLLRFKITKKISPPPVNTPVVGCIPINFVRFDSRPSRSARNFLVNLCSLTDPNGPNSYVLETINGSYDGIGRRTKVFVTFQSECLKNRLVRIVYEAGHVLK